MFKVKSLIPSPNTHTTTANAITFSTIPTTTSSFVEDALHYRLQVTTTTDSAQSTYYNGSIPNNKAHFNSGTALQKSSS